MSEYEGNTTNVPPVGGEHPPPIVTTPPTSTLEEDVQEVLRVVHALVVAVDKIDQRLRETQAKMNALTLQVVHTDGP